MKEQCKQAIYSYVDAETQMNAALTGEHSEYVELVVTVLRQLCRGLIDEGETEFVIPDDIVELFNNECPW